MVDLVVAWVPWVAGNCCRATPTEVVDLVVPWVEATHFALCSLLQRGLMLQLGELLCPQVLQIGQMLGPL